MIEVRPSCFCDQEGSHAALALLVQWMQALTAAGRRRSNTLRFDLKGFLDVALQWMLMGWTSRGCSDSCDNSGLLAELHVPIELGSVEIAHGVH